MSEHWTTPDGEKPSYDELYNLVTWAACDEYILNLKDDPQQMVNVLRNIMHSRQDWARNVLEGKPMRDERR